MLFARFFAIDNEEKARLSELYSKEIEVLNEKNNKKHTVLEIIGGLSHEINNPLQIVMLNTLSLKREKKDFATLKKLDAIDNSILRISILSSLLREFKDTESEKLSTLEFIESLNDLKCLTYQSTTQIYYLSTEVLSAVRALILTAQNINQNSKVKVHFFDSRIEIYSSPIAADKIEFYGYEISKYSKSIIGVILPDLILSDLGHKIHLSDHGDYRISFT